MQIDFGSVRRHGDGNGRYWVMGDISGNWHNARCFENALYAPNLHIYLYMCAKVLSAVYTYFIYTYRAKCTRNK